MSHATYFSSDGLVRFTTNELCDSGGTATGSFATATPSDSDFMPLRPMRAGCS
jgi:hypothetical protein